MLRAGQSGDRIPVGARFSAPVQVDPGVHQYPIKWVPGHLLGRGVDHPPPSNPEVKEREELPSGPS